MRFKVDENLHPEIALLLRLHGHDAVTVWDQQIAGASDAELATLCQSESRALVTLDVGFGDLRRYPPHAYAGLLVLRMHSQDRAHVLKVVERLLPMLDTEPLAGNLWVVEEHAVRVRAGRSE
jgi:predicted nuclease of predicted toxin-antitoxin system